MSDLKVGDKIKILVDNPNYTRFNAGDFAYIEQVTSSGQIKVTGAWYLERSDLGKHFELVPLNIAGTPSIAGFKFSVGEKIYIPDALSYGNIESYDNITQLYRIILNNGSIYRAYESEINSVAVLKPQSIASTTFNPAHLPQPCISGGGFGYGKSAWDPGLGDFTREYQSDINSKIGVLISKKCDCGTSKTYGTEAQMELHSSWCSMRSNK